MSFLATAFGTKVAIAALSLVAIGGGTAVAASAGVLPGVPTSAPTPVTSSAPARDDAPETARPTAEPTGEPTESATHAPSEVKGSDVEGPDAEGPAAFGLCTAYTAGGVTSTSVAYAALVRAAKSSSSIGAYCAQVLTARHAAHPTPTATPEVPDASRPTAGPELSRGMSSVGGSHGH